MGKIPGLRPYQGEEIDKIPEVIKTAIMKGEKILYTRLVPKSGGGCLLTNKRLIFFSVKKTGIFGGSQFVDMFADSSWQNLKIASIDESMGGYTVHLDMDGIDKRIHYLSKDDAEKVCEIARKMKETTLEKSSSTQNPVQNLKHLRDMLDKEFITQAEYDTKKADILSKM